LRGKGVKSAEGAENETPKARLRGEAETPKASRRVGNGRGFSLPWELPLPGSLGV